MMTNKDREKLKLAIILMRTTLWGKNAVNVDNFMLDVLQVIESKKPQKTIQEMLNDLSKVEF